MSTLDVDRAGLPPGPRGLMPRSIASCLALTLGLSGCGEPRGAHATSVVTLGVRDMQSDFGVASASEGTGWADYGPDPCATLGFTVQISALTFAPSTPGGPARYATSAERSAILDAVRGGLAVVRIDDGRQVDADVLEGCVAPDGAADPELHAGLAVSVVPRAPLSAGWYVLRADLGPVAALGLELEMGRIRHLGDVAYARFRVGSEPAWSLSTFECHGRPSGGCRISALFTERVDVGDATSVTLRVRSNEVDLECPVSRHAFGVAAECPRPADGDVLELILDAADILDPRGGSPGPMRVAFGPELYDGVAIAELLVVPELGLEHVRSSP